MTTSTKPLRLINPALKQSVDFLINLAVSMRSVLTILFFLLLNLCNAQRIADTTINVPMVSLHFSGQLPFGDLGDRFGSNLAVGGSFLFKAQKTWILGAEGSYFFGRNVKENVSIHMKNSDGFIVDNDGYPADLRITERGFNAFIVVGKLFPKLGHNPNSGFITTFGFGYLQHKIKLYDANQKIAAVNGDIAKGYDRLSGGFAMNQFLGYLFLSSNRLVNFEAGFEFYQAFTKSYRGYNYDTGLPDTKNRMDYLVGFRIGWTLPLYKRTIDFYYN